ncbi:Phage tail tape measure protein [Wolbachia endosymbiont of Culex quinquefasciatus JHB]|uniref:phage tail tape measure protein n=1 Tax=Wolbachia endosymbiont of Culex quinquefasciatus TaxID=263437 RepID=UPI0001761DB9|nr:phage tail tape measure protein [Wolbachia endosymbiont of Culex quinquefasciatus]EEB55264.1 Phage tail tape measure protein [Wolbachia endosymbiont of Culex quinquefasciatus JHB]EEB55450.1 Phage tail tape measure protein [Wolbachia endosymbiont of Culex quinquefasciatus JHB]EEB56070.1 Phage tail tape measure protein [Wolbachia endosymbiont of Culex quinquefasciatus JHB]CAQ54556.1 Phage tail tape measure protein [Wolbachia endosymbiont of Culex quinquefasciatus Pel]
MSMLSIKIGATLDGSFNSAMTGSAAKLSKLGDSIKQLDSSMKSVSKFKQLNHDALEAMKNWKEAEKKSKESAAAIAKEKKEKKEPSKALKNEFEKLKASASKAKEAYIKKRDALHTLNEEVRKSGKDIKSLVRDQTKLGSSIEVLKGKYSKLGSVIQKQQNALAKKAHYRSQVMETIGLGLSLAAPIKVAIDFESAMADVKKVVKFQYDEEMNEFSENIKKLSREIPLSAAELAQIAASGGQLGIDKNKLLGFTTTVAKMATAFDMSAEQAGDSIAKLSNVYGIDVSEMEHVGNVINHLSDNSAAKAKDMVEALAIVGGTAKQFGLDIKETSSLVNAFVSLGKQPAKAATAINALLSKLQTAEGQGKEFKAALESIGITAEEMSQKIAQNGQDALLYFFETLEKVDKQERSQILLNLFGQEYQDDIALIVGSLKKYEDAIAFVADKEKYKHSMQEEFDNRARTTANNLQLLKNTIAELGMNLGSIMLPPLNWISKILRSISTGIAWFAEKCPILTTGVMSIISALIIGKIAVVGFGYAFALAGGGILTFKAILQGTLLPVLTSLSARVIPAVIMGLKALTLTNPIGAAIAGLSFGAALVIANWQKVKDFFSSLWKSITKSIENWIGIGKFFNDSPIKALEKPVEAKIGSATSENNVFSKGNPLLNNNAFSGVSNSRTNIIESVITEKSSVADNSEKVLKDCEKCEQKIFNQTFTFNISIKAEPNQDVRSLADAVIKRIREKSRDVLFDSIEPIY